MRKVERDIQGRTVVLQLLVDEFGILEATDANDRFDDLFTQALDDVDPMEPGWHWRMADWIADRY